MPKLGVSGVTIDARDPTRLAAWWGEALGWTTSGRVCHPPEGAGYRIEFMPVADDKQVKNRVHLDLVANEVQPEVDRLIGMGATVAWEEAFPEDLGYRNVVLRDPEGNEFCVSGPPAAEDDAPRSGVGRRRVELLDVDSVAQAVTARGASSTCISVGGAV